jgi:hypothetical protein
MNLHSKICTTNKYISNYRGNSEEINKQRKQFLKNQDFKRKLKDNSIDNDDL